MNHSLDKSTNGLNYDLWYDVICLIKTPLCIKY